MRISIGLALFSALLFFGRVSIADDEVQVDEGSNATVVVEGEGASVELEITRPELQKKLRRAKAQTGVGMGLTFTGAGFILTGAAIIVGAVIQAEYVDEEEDGMGPAMAFLGGGIIAGAGLILAFPGLVIWFYGRQKEKNALEKLGKLPSISITSGGLYNTRMIGLSWKF